MPDLDEYLRSALHRTVRPVDVNDLTAKIDARRTRRARVRKVQAVALTVVVLAGTIGGVAMLSRVFGETRPGSNGDGPTGPPTSGSPVPSPTPSETQGDDIGLGFPVCNVRTLGGDAAADLDPDFDGNGSVDTAYVATKMSDVGGCPQADRASNILGIDLTGDGRIDAEFGPIGCELDCRPFMAIDLDDDGDDELLVQQLGGAILGLVPYLIVGSDNAEADGPGIGELVIAPPGDPDNGYTAGGPVTFYVGGDEGFSAALGCRGSGAERVLIATTGQLDSIEQPSTWAIQRPTFRLGDQGLEIVGFESFDRPFAESMPAELERTKGLCGVPFPPNPAFET